MTLEVPAWHNEARRLIQKPEKTEPIVTLFRATVPVLDRSGRPYRESPNSPNPAGVTFTYVLDMVTGGGREGMEENSSAFAEVPAVFPKAMGLVSFFREEILPYTRKTTVDGVADVIHAVSAFPFWLLLNDNPMENGDVPPFVTVAGKAIAGAAIPYNILAEAKLKKIISNRVTLPEEAPLTDSRSFLRYVFRNKLLILETEGPEANHACPAPVKMITQLATVLFDEPWGNKDAVREELNLSADDVKRVKKFGFAYKNGLNEQKFFWSYILSNQMFIDAILDGGSISVRLPGSSEDVNIVDRHLRVMNNCQKWINEALGRKKPPKLTREDLTRELRDKLAQR